MKEKIKKNFRPAVALLVFTAVVALIAVFTLPRHAQAQPFYTNNGATGNTNFAGAYTPNQNVPWPGLSIERQNYQYNAGIASGIILPGGFPGTSYTNSLTAMSYTVAPIVTAVGSAPSSNAVIAVTSVTSSNFVLTTVTTNTLTVYWTAVGH
jgi:hypothetical protein